MKKIVILLLLVSHSSPSLAHDSGKIKALEKRIQALETRLEKLSPTSATNSENAQQRKEEQKLQARERMRKDSAIYSRDDLREIESLYQVANKQWRSDEGKNSLQKLIAQYDQANRTGCALLYLGQMSKGEERVKYLKQAIEGFSDCFYGNGVQVGAYARYYLAHHYKENGQAAESEKLFKEITQLFPDALDHKGRFLSELMAQ